jgi:hypothetical protein
MQRNSKVKGIKSTQDDLKEVIEHETEFIGNRLKSRVMVEQLPAISPRKDMSEIRQGK